jgi:hypothetical protein
MSVRTPIAWTRIFPPVCAAGFAALLAAGCGSNGGTACDCLPVGSDDDAGGSFVGTDTGTSGPLDASIQENHVTVSILTLSCAGDCADVEAVPTGGHPPYTFAWDDGSTSATRRVCPTSTTNYYVKVTDSALTGEISQPAETVKVPLTADVLACLDGAAALGDGGCGTSEGPPPAPGHYVGTITCGPGSQWQSYGAPGGPADGGPEITPDGGGGALGTISLDLSIDPTTGKPAGTWYFQWNLAVIAGGGSLQGTFECGGSQIDDTFVNSTWGLPGANMTVITTGGLAGSLTAANTPGPGAIGGFFTYMSSVAGNTGDVCVGSYTATLSSGDD